MIKNQNDTSYYTNYNKIYIPSDYVNANYSYRFNNDYIIIVTNRNCYTQYNTTYCDCNSYNWKTNVMSSSYACSTTSNTTQVIPYNSITSDINYSTYIRNVFLEDKIIYLVIFVVAILFGIFITKERKHL